MPHIVVRVTAGFLAGAITVSVFHQGMYFILKQIGVPLQGLPWNMAALPAAYGLPVLANQMFWGGLWGILFAVLYDVMPGGQGSLKGLLFGMVFPMLLGSWLIVAALKGQPLLAGFLADWNILKLRPGFFLNGIAFGIGIGILYPLLAGAVGHRATSRG